MSWDLMQRLQDQARELLGVRSTSVVGDGSRREFGGGSTASPCDFIRSSVDAIMVNQSISFLLLG